MEGQSPHDPTEARANAHSARAAAAAAKGGTTEAKAAVEEAAGAEEPVWGVVAEGRSKRTRRRTQGPSRPAQRSAPMAACANRSCVEFQNIVKKPAVAQYSLHFADPFWC